MAEVPEAAVVSMSLFQGGPRIADELKKYFCEFSICAEGSREDPVLLWKFCAHVSNFLSELIHEFTFEQKMRLDNDRIAGLVLVRGRCGGFEQSVDSCISASEETGIYPVDGSLA